MTRYMVVVVVFSVYIVLAMAGRSPKVDQTIRALFLVLLALLSALYAAHIAMVMS